MIERGQYPVQWFNDYTIMLWISSNMVPRTVRQVAERYNLTTTQARRLLDKRVKQGQLYRRYMTEWNGMYYIKVGYYW